MDHGAFSRARRTGSLAAALVLACACSSQPKASPGLLAMEKGPRVTVSGVVRDAATGEPVAGIEVYGLPRGKDIPWEPPSMTDEQGRFTLRLTAPAKYAFLLRDHGISILTPEKDDPGYVDIVTKPGEKIEGVELKFLREKFQTPP